MEIEFVDSNIYHIYVRKYLANGKPKYYLATNICRGHAKGSSRYGPAIELEMDKITGEITVIKQIDAKKV